MRRAQLVQVLQGQVVSWSLVLTNTSMQPISSCYVQVRRGTTTCWCCCCCLALFAMLPCWPSGVRHGRACAAQQLSNTILQYAFNIPRAP